MDKRCSILLLLLAALLSGCGAKENPLVGAYSLEGTESGVYVFLEDGTGARTEYPYPASDESIQHTFSYFADSGRLILRFSDGSQETYQYTLGENRLLLTSDADALLLTRIGDNKPASAPEVWKDYWSLFMMTAVALFFQHLVMPYTPRFHPPLDDMPELCFPTFSRGQLMQYLVQVPTLPAILLGCVWLSACLGVSKEIAIALASILTGLWGLLPPQLARKIDGW